jgi:hypothetical protein
MKLQHQGKPGPNMSMIGLGVIVELLRLIEDETGATFARLAIGRLPSQSEDVVAVGRAHRRESLAESGGVA